MVSLRIDNLLHFTLHYTPEYQFLSSCKSTRFRIKLEIRKTLVKSKPFWAVQNVCSSKI